MNIQIKLSGKQFYQKNLKNQKLLQVIQTTKSDSKAKKNENILSMVTEMP